MGHLLYNNDDNEFIIKLLSYWVNVE